MSRTIWKFTVPVDDEAHTFDWPQDHDVLHIGCQGNDAANVQMWVELDPNDTNVKARWVRSFTVIGTGHSVPERSLYLGTAPTAGGLVWHLYEVNR